MEDIMVIHAFSQASPSRLYLVGFSETSLAFITIRVRKEQKQLLIPGRIN
jgi:hypothetical protein